MVAERGRRAGAVKDKSKPGQGAAHDVPSSAFGSDDAGQVVEYRFKHLLEPIRDLALNWNLDIAHELQNYLGQLEQVQVSLDGGLTLLNFAEAALLIQGTTCIYSRKVEYLHRLVMQVLDVIHLKRAKAASKDAPEGEFDEEGAFLTDPDFISLDDIPEARSEAIDMVEKAGSMLDNELELGSAPPLVVVMNIEGDRDNSDPNKDLRLSNALMHESGALLLDPCSASQLDVNLLPRKQLSVSGIANSSISPERIRADRNDSVTPVLAGISMEHSAAAGEVGISPPHMEEINYGRDDSEREDSGELDACDFIGGDDTFKRIGSVSSVCKKIVSGLGDDDDDEDLWRLLDPHDSRGHAARPFRKGSTVRRPPLRASESSEGSSSIDLWTKQMRSLRAPAFAEFSDIFLQERNRLASLRLAASNSAQGGRSHRAGLYKGLLGKEFVISQIMDLTEPCEDGDDLHLPMPGDGGDGCVSGDDEGEEGVDYPEGGLGDCGGDGGEEVWYGGTVSTGKALAVSGLGREWEVTGGREWDLLSYEDLCRQHVEHCLRGAEDFLQRSTLEQRVRAWRSKIEPALQAEEARTPFDIHACGKQVKLRLSGALNALSPQHKETAVDQSPSVTFAAAVQGLEQHEVCRAFLATLQLANDGSVDIAIEVSTYVAPSVASARKKQTKRAKVDCSHDVLPTQMIQLPTQPLDHARSEVHTAGGSPSDARADLHSEVRSSEVHLAAEGGCAPGGDGEGGARGKGWRAERQARAGRNDKENLALQ